MTQELRKARRELAALKRHLHIMQWFVQWGHYDNLNAAVHSREARRVSRDLARRIKRQELEVRAQTLQEKGALVYLVPNVPNRARVWIDTRTVTFDGRNAYVRALKWAERQNRKAGASE